MKKLIFLFLLLQSIISLRAEYTIYPIPQKMQMGVETIQTTPQLTIITEEQVNETTKERLEEILDRFGLTGEYGSQPVAGKTTIYIGTNGSDGVVDRYLTTHQIPRNVFAAGANQFDPYLLQVNANQANGEIVIVGDANGSAYYALATLEQMLEQKGNNLEAVTFEDFSFTQYRGIVEGFYGRPWSVENRLDLLDYCKRYKMNVFVYGPKSDPYHLGKWRDDYPTSLTEHEKYFGQITQEDLSRLAAKARECHVDFVWAVHPAMQNGISFSSESAMNPGIDAIMTKFEHLHQLGLRGFGVFIDDLSYTPSGAMQAYLADQVQKRLHTKYNSSQADEAGKVAPLFFVPTAYALNYGGSSSLNSLKSIDKDVVVMFTGYDCFSNIRGSASDDMANRIGRNAVMWWNNPVNDDHDDRIYMRELTAHWTIEDQAPISSLHGLILNPMSQAQASKISLFGAADYAWNPARFDTTKNWEASFQSIITDDVELKEALRLFALHSNSTIEEENLKQLYAAFQTGYSVTQLPAVTDDVLAETERIYKACILLGKMKDSTNPAHRLLYEDIRCWLAKLESMTSLISRSIRLMQSSGELSLWTEYSGISEEYKKLHTDSAFLVSAFEGQGTSTYEVFYEVHPAQTYIEPFAGYVVEKLLSDHSPKLPERSREPEVITNIEDLSTVQITTSGSEIKLIHLNEVKLQHGEYIGANLNAIKEVIIHPLPSTLTDYLTIEHSINGKEWSTFFPDGTPVQMVYFRLKNLSETAHEMTVDEIGINIPPTEKKLPKDIVTNLPEYQTYTIRKVIDGDTTSFFWSSRAQRSGDYITLEFDTTIPCYGITLRFRSGDYITGTARIDLSEDNQSWATIATFTAGDFDSQYAYSCNAAGKRARYVRFYIESSNNSEWLQLSEFEVNNLAVIPVAYDDKEAGIDLLDDRYLTQGFKASSAGHVVYLFTENIWINEVNIFHNTVFDKSSEKPSVYVYSQGDWAFKGFLDESCTTIDTAECNDSPQLKISWNDTNIPCLYEIMPVGEKYIETNTAVSTDSEARTERLDINTENHIITITTSTGLKEITLYTLAGTIIDQRYNNANYMEIPVDTTQSMALLKTVLDDDMTQIHKIIF